MCTATFIPLAKGFLFGANRDESPRRGASVKVDKIHGRRLWYPKEPRHGGTNLAVSDAGEVLCLLNGAYEPYQRKPEYNKSRGLVLLDSFAYSNLAHFADEYSLKDIEPFTLVRAAPASLETLRWTGQQVEVNDKNNDQPHLWASRLMYDATARKKRLQWFADFLKSRASPGLPDLKKFHLEAGDGIPETDIVMKRGDVVQTVSSTVIRVSGQEAEIIHTDLLSGRSDNFSFR